MLNAIKLLEQRKEVLSAEPCYFYSIDSHPTPTPSNYSYQRVAFDRVFLPRAWDYTTGSASVMVGVMDTGIDQSNPALSNRINAGLSRDFSTGSTTGLVNDRGLRDNNRHGTAVAGVIGTNGNGVIGVCWNVTLVSLKVFADNGNNNGAYIIRAVNFAASEAIPILNFSGGGYAYSFAQLSAIRNYRGLFVCAAGNTGRNTDISPYYPSCYYLDNLISVGIQN